MKQALADLFSSKKFLTAMVALVVTGGALFGLQLDGEIVAAILGLFAVLIGAQGAADFGKAAAANKPTTTQNVTVNEAPATSPSSGPTVTRIGPISIVMLLALVLSLTFGACTASRPYLPPVTHPIVDCAAASHADALVVSWFTRRPSWDVVKDEAIAAGVEAGGCAFAAYVQKYLAPAPGTAAPAPEDAIAAKDSFEQYRNKYALNASFRFKDGDL